MYVFVIITLSLLFPYGWGYSGKKKDLGYIEVAKK